MFPWKRRSPPHLTFAHDSIYTAAVADDVVEKKEKVACSVAAAAAAARFSHLSLVISVIFVLLPAAAIFSYHNNIYLYEARGPDHENYNNIIIIFLKITKLYNLI